MLKSPPLLGGLHQLAQLQLCEHCPSGCQPVDRLSWARYAKLIMEQLLNLMQLRSRGAGYVSGFGVAVSAPGVSAGSDPVFMQDRP